MSADVRHEPAGEAGGGDVARLCEELRSRGARITRPLRAVLTALSAGGDHLTAGDVVALLEAGGERVQPSTVYRTLDRLSGWGVVDHVHVGHGALAYHLRPEPHAHLVCESCGRVIDIPGRLLGPLTTSVERDHGFALRAGHVALSGRCAGCRDQSAGAASSDRSSP